MGSGSIIIVIALAASAVAGPLGSGGPCARQCTESAKFQYEPGTSYFFDYESDAITTMQGTTAEESRLHLKAKVEIHAVSKCDLVMRLSGVSLAHSDPANPKSQRPVVSLDDFRQSLERYTLRFSFQDGVVETICPANGETTRVLNIKRGILSALQTSAGSLENAERVIETDVSGKCTVNYEPLGRGWNSVTVRKIKDLSSCTERHNAETAIQMNPFIDSKETKSMPLVRGNQECEQIFKHNRLASVMCSETHVFRPFSKQDGGAMTKVTQALTFSNEKKVAFTGGEFSTLRKVMTYDHEVDPAERERRTRQVEMTLVDLCMATRDDIRPSVPGKFTTFVYGLRQLEDTDLVNMYRRVERICPENTKAKKLYLDGVTMAGTSGAIKFIVDLMQRGEIPEKDVDLWISTLAFVNKPNKDALVALLPLLDGQRMDAVLPVSAVVHTFCRQNAECGLKNEVRQVVQKIAEMLGNNCNGDKKKVMLALKALGNMGVAFETEEKLQSCAQNPNLDTEIRVAGIQAYRRLSCDVMRSPIMDLYMNQEENVEVRIAAFLNVMRCPSEATFMKIKETMETEKIKQVGSYVMSYLKNIEKQTQYKAEVQEIVSNVEYLNKFESDFRKFSRNFQNSLFISSLDSGLSMDSDVIFDTTSYLPRSLKLNLTADVMGAKINFLELEGRAEGLTKVVERMFGPEGYFRNGKESSRSKKSVSDNKIEKYDKKFDVKSNFDDNPALSLDMKIFGNSLWFKKFQEGNMVSEAFSAMDIMVQLAKEQEMELTKSFLFLDTTVNIPTGSGMPLKLAINGSAVMNLKMSGKVDARSMDNVDVHGKIQPSGAIEIATLMSVDAGIARTGLKMVATLHTSTILDGAVEVRGGKVYQARLNMPREQLEIIDVQSRIFLVNGEEEREQKNAVEQNTLYSQCTGAFTKKPMGVEFCGELQLPTPGRKNTPLYPLSGPAKFRMFLRKTDPALTSYNVEMRWTEDKDGRDVVGQHLVMSFNTPESRIDREVSAEFHLNKQESTLSMKLKVPNKKLALTGKRVFTDTEKRLSMAVSIDDQEKFSLTTSLVGDPIESGVRYQAGLEVRGPSSRLLNVRSSASIKNLKYNGDITVEGLTKTPVVMNGEISIGERNRYEVNGMIDSYALDAKLKGHAQFRNGFSSKINVQYKIMEGIKETLDITSKIRDLSANGLTKYSGAASLVSSALPEITSSISWETQFTTGHIENSLELSLGDGRVKRIQKIAMSEILKYQGNLENNNVEGSFRMTYPEKDIDFALQLNHKNTLENLVNTVNLKYAPGREASSSVELNMNARPLRMTGDVQFKYPGRDMRLQGNVNQKGTGEFETSVTAQWQRGKQVRAVGNFIDASTRNGRDYQTRIEMTIPNYRPMSLVSQVTALPGRYLISADGEFGKGPYGLKGEYNVPSFWNHRASAIIKTPRVSYTAEGALQKNGEMVSGKLDVNIPEYRHVTGSVEISNGAKVKTGAMDFMWDADRDQSRRVQMESEFRLNADGNQGSFNLKSPIKSLSGSYNTNYAGQFSSGIMRGNVHAEVEWEPSQKYALDFGGNFALKQSRRQITGEVKLATPINGYESMQMTVQHTDTLPEWNNKVTVQWKRNRKIVFGTEGKIRSDSSSSLLDTSMRMNTPFRGYESLSLREVFERRPSEISSSSYLQWATGKNIELSMSGAIVGSNGIRAGANFTSPFETLRDLSATFSNSFSRNTIDTDFDLRWNARNSITLNFDGRNTMTGRKHTCSAELQFVSTIPRYEKMSTKIVYDKDANTANLNSDLRWSNNRITVGLNGANKNSYYGYDMLGKMEYSSNFRNFERGEIKMAHVSDAQKFSSNVESTLPYNQKLNLKLLGNMPSYKEMDSSLTLTSSFIDDVEYQVAYKIDGYRLAANGMATYGAQKMTGDIQSTAQIGNRAWNLEYTVNINTPIRGMETMKFSLTQVRKQLQFTTRMRASKNQDTITLNHDMKIEDALNFVNNMQLTTPFRNWRSMEVNNRQVGKASEYKHNSEVTWGSNKAMVSMELNIPEQRRGRNFEARLNAKSPFETLSSLDIEMKHQDDQRTYRPRFSAEWNGNNKVALDGVLNNNRFKKMDASLTTTSSFPGYETLVLIGKYDITTRQKTAEMSYRWNERSNKAITLSGIFEAEPRNGMIDFTATTPVQGLETLKLKSDYALVENERSLNIFAQYGDKRYTFNGKQVGSPNGEEVNAQISTPLTGYKKLAAFGTYTIGKNLMNTEVSYEWENKKVVLNADYRNQNGEMVGKVNVNTPFNGYKKMALKVEGNVQSPRKTGSVMIQWDPSNTITATGAFESDYSRFGNMNVDFRSPFEGFKEMSMNGEIKQLPGEYSAEATAQWMPSKKVTGNILVKPNEIIVTFDTPFRPYKNVRFVTNIDKSQNEAKASLEWENTKKADISANYKVDDKVLEGKVELNLPLNGRKTYSISGNFMNDNFKMMEGRVQIRTPEESYETSSLIRKTNDNREITVSFEGPKSKFTVNGKLMNQNYREMEGSLKTESNIRYIPSFAVKGSYRNEDWKNIQVSAQFNEDHSLSSSLKNDDNSYQFETTVESTLIPSKRVTVSMNANTKDIRNMDGRLSLETNSQRHVLTASEKISKRGFEAEFKADSPVLRGGQASASIFYSNKKNNDIQGKISVFENREPHIAEFTFNNGNRDIVGTINIQCRMIPSGKLDVEGKLSRPTDNALETSLTALTGSSRHSIVASGKLLDNQMEMSVTLDSPIVAPRAISLTASLDNDDFKNIRGSVVLKSTGGESRFAFNMKRSGWRDVEAFFTMNIPTGSLKMLRVDMKMKNEGLRSMEGSLDITSSLEAIRMVSFSGKMKDAENAWDMSINSKLPVRQWDNISVLATVHKNREWSRVSPRITVSLPKGKYVVYAKYEKDNEDLQASIGSEWDNQKSELSVEKHTTEYRANLVTPIRGYESFNVVANFRNNRGGRTALIVFRDPKQQEYTAEATLNFNNLVNFNGEANLKTPFDGLRDVSTKLRQAFRRGRWTMTFEHNMEGNKKAALTIEHETNPLSGTVSIVTPLDQMKITKMNYNWKSSPNTNGKMEIEVNNRNILRLELERAYQSESRAYSNSVQIELPTFPYTLTVTNKPLPSGSELIIKSVLPKRSLSFQSMYQSSSTLFSHGAHLSLDESNGQTISYEIRSSLTPRQGSEYIARLNMPIRSLELRTTHEKTSTGRTVSGDFLWDASRDKSRHMKLTLEHTDNSNRYNVAHKIRLTAAHPQLSKDIVLATECLLSPSEIYGKTEVEYSRYQQHNIFLEARAASNPQSRREKRYVASLAARHPVTNLDMKLSAEVANNQQEMAAEMKINYLDRNLRQQIQELRTKIQKVKQEIDLETRINDNKLNVHGSMFHKDNELTLALKQTVNNKAPTHSHLRWNQRQKNLDIDIASINGDRLHLVAKLPDDHVEAEISHIVSGREFNDGKFYLGLRDSKILESRITWRPEVYAEAKESLSRAYNHHVSNLQTAISNTQEEISNEIDTKSDMMSRAVMQETRPFMTEISKEMKKLRIDSQRGSNELYQMYRRDEFFMRTAGNYMSNVLEVMSKSYDSAIKFVSQKYEIFAETVSMTVDILQNIFEEMVEDVVRMGRYYQKAARRMLAKWADDISKVKREYIDGLAKIVTDMSVKALDYLEDVVSDSYKWMKYAVSRYSPAAERYWKAAVKDVKKMIDWLRERYGDQLKTVTDHPSFIAMNEYIARVMETVSKFQEQLTYDQMLRGTRMFMSNSVDNLAAAYAYVRDHPNINYMNEAVSSSFDQGRRIATSLGMNTMMVNIAEELYQKVQHLAWNTVRDMAEEYTSIRGNARMIYEPENGRIEIEMKLPVVKSSLKQLLDVNSYPQIQKLRELGSQVSFGDFCIWDTYYKYKRYLDTTYWLPPFDAQAMIVGDHHYITFDNFNFDFAGECSYLLARDFLDKNFTVTVNYARDNNRVIKKSVNVYTDGVKVEISRDNKVTIDDRKVELPQDIGQTRLAMEDGVITVTNKAGYSIRCNFVHDVCTMKVSGFYFGRTGGLFGTHNYEPALDLMTSEKKLAQNLEEFADSWQVGSAQCTKGRNLAEDSPVDLKAKEKCETLFKNFNSEFRSGFRQVDPEPFLRMCINDLSPIREAERKQKICTSAAAYVESCRQQGVNLNMPKHCVRCERLNADDLESGDVVKITKDEPVRAADIVYVVEEKGCNKNVGAVLSKLAQSLEDGFRSMGYRQVHFAVVGFGGDGIHSEPHVVTSDSQIFGTVRNIDSALNSLPTGNGESNIFTALRYAAGLPFTTGSTKTFILSKCSECKAQEMKADYSEMLRTMLDSDITLHLLMEHEFATKAPNKPEQAKKVLGFDRKYAYTTKDIKNTELKGDRDLLAQLKTPKDLCVPLALEGSGSFFSLERLQDRRSANKKTVEVMSRRILKTAKPAECQICECIATQSGIGKSVCQRCVSPVVAQLVSDDSPMINYGTDYIDNDVE